MSTIRRALSTLLLSLVATLLIAAADPAAAQTPPPVTPGATLLFDHDGLNVASWDMQLDTGAWTTVSPVRGDRIGTTTPAVYAWAVPFPAATPGAHTLKIRACNIAGCAVSDPYAFQMVLIPSKPGNLRFGGLPTTPAP